MDKYTEKSMNSYNKKADDYMNTRDYTATKKLKDVFIDYLSKQNINGKNVLDLACGIGDLLNELYERNSVIGTGIDIADNMIQKANDLYGDHIKFLNTNAENILVEDNSQDIVTICCAFHHLSNPQKVLTEVNRVLRNKGCFYIADFTLPSFLNGICKIISPVLMSGDVKMYNKKDLEILCAKTGFTIEQYDKIGTVSYIAKLKKIYN